MAAHALRVALVAVVGLLTVCGCQKEATPPANQVAGAANAAAEVDQHDLPLSEAEIESLKANLESYEEALAEIRGYRDAIRNAIAAGDPTEAHRPLDELDIVLAHLPTVARENDIPRSEWETINTSAQRIRELFNQVHSQIDAGEEAGFEAVAEEINSQIASLESVSTS